MTIIQIKNVVEVAKVHSISQASINLNITQPNLSQSIRKLEEELGTQIFHRTSVGVMLTPFGQRFVSNAEEVLLQFELLEDTCHLHSANTPMQISVVSGGYLFVTKQLISLYEKYSRNPMEIQYHEGSGQRVVNMIENDKADIGFVSLWNFDRRSRLKRITTAGLEYHHLINATPCIYVDKRHPDFTDDDTVVNLEKIKNLPYISTNPVELPPALLFKCLFPKTNYNDFYCATRIITLGNTSSMRDILALTNGFAIGSFCSTVYDSSNFYENLRVIPFAPGIFECEIGWIQKSNIPRKMLVDELVNALRINIM